MPSLNSTNAVEHIYFAALLKLSERRKTCRYKHSGRAHKIFDGSQLVFMPLRQLERQWCDCVCQAEIAMFAAISQITHHNRYEFVRARARLWSGLGLVKRRRKAANNK